MLWRFSANDSHLYAGALLRSLDAPNGARLSAGHDLLVEFSDGVLTTGRLREVEANMAVLRMPAYRTRRGTAITARTWRIVPGGESGLARVQRRLAEA